MRHLPVLAVLLAGTLSAQTGTVQVSVTDRLHRFVTGLEQENFEVLENGMPRAITSFSAVDTPMALAVVTVSEVDDAERLGRPGDEVSVSSTLQEALRHLADAKNTRKILVLAAPVNADSVPAGIQVLQVAPVNVSRAAVEVQNQYVLQYQSSAAGTRVEIVVKQPRGLPVLKANWN